MFWCPNDPNEGDSIDSIQGWFPGPDYVDIVGIDVYPVQPLQTRMVISMASFPRSTTNISALAKPASNTVGLSRAKKNR